MAIFGPYRWSEIVDFIEKGICNLVCDFKTTLKTILDGWVPAELVEHIFFELVMFFLYIFAQNFIHSEIFYSQQLNVLQVSEKVNTIMIIIIIINFSF